MGLGSPNFACSLIYWVSTKIAQIIALGSNLAPPQGSQVLLGFIKGKLLLVALSSGPSPKGVNCTLGSNLLRRDTSFTWVYIVKSLEIFLLLNIITMATNFSPC